MSDDLRQLLKRQMEAVIPKAVVMCEVTGVDEAKLSITARQLDTGIELYDIRLVPAMETQANSIVSIPKTGALILVGMISNMPSANYMIMCQECEKVIINGGDFGGLIKIEELQKQMKKDSDILQALLDVIMGVTILEPGSSASSALQIALKTKMINLQKGDYASIENKNVIHG